MSHYSPVRASFMRQAFPVAVRLWPWIGKADMGVFDEITDAGDGTRKGRRGRCQTRTALLYRSSQTEQLTLNPRVEGSRPPAPTNFSNDLLNSCLERFPL